MSSVPFKDFFVEASLSNIDRINHDVDDIDKRPFNELFGNRDRFIVKDLKGTLRDFMGIANMNPRLLSSDLKTYDSQNINTFLKRKREDFLRDKNIYEAKNISNIKQHIDQRNVWDYYLFSRHPIDVLRMSDHKGISSCHSLNGSYDYCAWADARNNGGIVYIIKSGDVGKVIKNLNAREIFADIERTVDGIEPLARVRLRRFVDIKQKIDFAVPEMRYYRIQGNTMGHTGKYVQNIVNFVKARQKISRQNLSERYIRKNIFMLGGEYVDIPISKILDNYFGTHLSKKNSGEENNWAGRTFETAIETRSSPSVFSDHHRDELLYSFIHSKNKKEYLKKLNIDELTNIYYTFFETHEDRDHSDLIDAVVDTLVKSPSGIISLIDFLNNNMDAIEEVDVYEDAMLYLWKNHIRAVTNSLLQMKGLERGANGEFDLTELPIEISDMMKNGINNSISELDLSQKIIICLADFITKNKSPQPITLLLEILITCYLNSIYSFANIHVLAKKFFHNPLLFKKILQIPNISIIFINKMLSRYYDGFFYDLNPNSNEPIIDFFDKISLYKIKKTRMWVDFPVKFLFNWYKHSATIRPISELPILIEIMASDQNLFPFMQNEGEECVDIMRKRMGTARWMRALVASLNAVSTRHQILTTTATMIIYLLSKEPKSKEYYENIKKLKIDFIYTIRDIDSHTNILSLLNDCPDIIFSSAKGIIDSEIRKIDRDHIGLSVHDLIHSTHEMIYFTTQVIQKELVISSPLIKSFPESVWKKYFFEIFDPLKKAIIKKLKEYANFCEQTFKWSDRYYAPYKNLPPTVFLRHIKLIEEVFYNFLENYQLTLHQKTANFHDDSECLKFLQYLSDLKSKMSGQ